MLIRERRRRVGNISILSLSVLSPTGGRYNGTRSVQLCVLYNLVHDWSAGELVLTGFTVRLRRLALNAAIKAILRAPLWTGAARERERRTAQKQKGGLTGKKKYSTCRNDFEAKYLLPSVYVRTNSLIVRSPPSSICSSFHSFTNWAILTIPVALCHLLLRYLLITCVY